MVKVKFVAHSIYEILIPKLSRSKHFDLGLNPIENDPVLTPLYVNKAAAYLAD